MSYGPERTKVVCVEFGNNDDIWTWCYLDVREALVKAKELLMKQEPDERLVVGMAYCGQNLMLVISIFVALCCICAMMRVEEHSWTQNSL